ncbi:helix-turn-helix transcriptional regulator [Blautia pseudococcoides]|uniref:helix-turn-helix domain-containing protein n=1 Tax=Blautia pseudococcoides TaxID=1796616 RepID=UPI003514D451
MQINLEIKKYLEENGITQAFISRKTGIEPSKLSIALNGDRKFTLEEYSLICGVLGVNTDRFLKPQIPKDRETA